MNGSVGSLRGFLLLLAAFALAGTTACNGIDEGDAIGQASAAGNIPVRGFGDENETDNDAAKAPKIELHLPADFSADKTNDSEGAVVVTQTATETGEAEVTEGDMTIRIPPASATKESEPARDDTGKLLSLGTEEPPDLNMPLTYLCVTGDSVAAYYLYKPGRRERLCELHYSGTADYYFADWEHNYCELKLAEALQKRIKAGETCYCGRPGGPDGVLRSTEEGLVCGKK